MNACSKDTHVCEEIQFLAMVFAVREKLSRQQQAKCMRYQDWYVLSAEIYSPCYVLTARSGGAGDCVPGTSVHSECTMIMTEENWHSDVKS